jgi:hypothetical protein
MATVNQVDKRVKLSRWSIVKYQLITHCYLAMITLSESDLDCLTFLAINGEQELTSFCNMAFNEKIFSSTQSVRNCLTKAEKKNLIKKEGKNKKKIYINPELNVHATGNILLDYKFLSIETDQG